MRAASLPIDYPARYEFTFNVRGDAPPNALAVQARRRDRRQRLVGEPPDYRVPRDWQAHASGSGTSLSPGGPRPTACCGARRRRARDRLGQRRRQRQRLLRPRSSPQAAAGDERVRPTSRASVRHGVDGALAGRRERLVALRLAVRPTTADAGATVRRRVGAALAATRQRRHLLRPMRRRAADRACWPARRPAAVELERGRGCRTRSSRHRRGDAPRAAIRARMSASSPTGPSSASTAAASRFAAERGRRGRAGAGGRRARAVSRQRRARSLSWADARIEPLLARRRPARCRPATGESAISAWTSPRSAPATPTRREPSLATACATWQAPAHAHPGARLAAVPGESADAVPRPSRRRQPDRDLAWDGGALWVNGALRLKPMQSPSSVRLEPAAAGPVGDWLAEAPPAGPGAWTSATPPASRRGAALRLRLGRASSATIAVVAAGHGGAPAGEARRRPRRGTVAARWRDALDRVGIDGPAEVGRHRPTRCAPPSAISSSTAAGPALQPGARAYARSWIRDGALTSSALLRLGP